jgi:hypothetical protein
MIDTRTPLEQQLGALLEGQFWIGTEPWKKQRSSLFKQLIGGSTSGTLFGCLVHFIQTVDVC